MKAIINDDNYNQTTYVLMKRRAELISYEHKSYASHMGFESTFSDVTWLSWNLKFQTTRTFLWQLIQANNKETYAFPTLARGNHRWPMGSLHKGPEMRKCFHITTSSWMFKNDELESLLHIQLNMNCNIDNNAWQQGYVRITSPCKGKPAVTDGFAAQGASNAKNASISWRHHECIRTMNCNCNSPFRVLDSDNLKCFQCRQSWRHDKSLCSIPGLSAAIHKTYLHVALLTLVHIGCGCAPVADDKPTSLIVY